MRLAITFIILLSQILSSSALDARYVQISIPVACMREGKAHASQLVSQSVLGTPMQVLESDGEWWKLKGPDGYEGFVNISSFVDMPDSVLIRWRKAPRLMVRPMKETYMYALPEKKIGRNIVSSMVNGSIVERVCEADSDFVSIILPDGKKGYVEKSDLVPLDSIPELDFDRLIDDCHTLSGTPYLWGGCSTKAMDCSGLVRIAFMEFGILLPRDAKDQYLAGEPVTDELKRGDLLFFSSVPDGGITHVALYDKDGRYIHCSGMVKTSEMTDSDPDFSKRHYRGARRISPDPLPQGAIRLGSHPWYF